MPANMLCHWAWRFRHESARASADQPEFVQLTSAPSGDTPASQRVEIVLRSKRRVIVDAGMDSEGKPRWDEEYRARAILHGCPEVTTRDRGR